MSSIRRAHLIVGALSFLVFLVIALLVLSNTTQNVDARLALIINNLDFGPAFTATMVTFTNYGREYFWVPIVAVMFLFGNQETKLLAIELAALFVIGIAFGEALKYLVYRDRPFETISGIHLRVPGDTDSSFPSGHALIVTIGAAFSLIKFKSKALASLLTLEAAFVCFSRVYVGLHYPSDVAAGIFLGVGIVGVGLYILEGRKLETLLKRLAALALRLLKNGPLQL
jgi:membrane-associated phospholipid phosphatase